MIIRYPDKWRAGELDDQLISFVDFKSTTLSLAVSSFPNMLMAGLLLANFSRQSRVSISTRRQTALTGSTTRSVQCAMNVSNTCATIIQSEATTTADLSRADANHAGAAASKEQDALTEAQSQWFRESKPSEELFDTLSDPHELTNLALDPAYSDKLLELRTELTSGFPVLMTWG